MTEIFQVLFYCSSVVGTSLTNFNTFLSKLIFLDGNVFVLGFLTSFELFLLTNILFFGKFSFRTFFTQGFLISGGLMSLFYKLDWTPFIGFLSFIFSFRAFLPTPIPNLTFADMMDRICDIGERHIEMQISGADNPICPDDY